MWINKIMGSCIESWTEEDGCRKEFGISGKLGYRIHDGEWDKIFNNNTLSSFCSVISYNGDYI